MAEKGIRGNVNMLVTLMGLIILKGAYYEDLLLG